MKASEYFALLWLRGRLMRIDDKAARRAVEIIDERVRLEKF